MKHLLHAAALSLAFITASGAATYYLDAASGSDASGNGSSGSPWQTVDKAKAAVTPGDSVILAGGTYAGYLDINATPNTGWITWQSAPGETAHFDTLNIGHQWDEEQQADKYVRFVNIAFSGKVFIRYSHHVEINGCSVGDVVALIAAHHIDIVDCDITSFEPHAFTYEAVRESGVGLGTKASAYCTNIRIEGCHIHNIGGAGIGARGDSITIKDNHIHSTANDGLILTCVRDALIEGNLIHDCDDGLFDGDTTDYYAIFYPDIPRDSTYRIGSMHTDGIHMRCDIYYTDGKPDLVKSQEYACRNIVFRGNTVYDVEAQGVILQGLPRRYTVIEGTDTTVIERTAVHPKNLLWENNVFGPTNGTMFYANHPIDTLVFRNNSVVYFPGGRDYVSSWRTVPQTNFSVAIVEGCTEVYVYNNIMVNVPGNVAGYKVFDYNLFRTNTQNEPLPRFSLLDTAEQFSDPGSLDGVLLASSPAVNAGTGADDICPWYPPYAQDKYGTAHDTRPDIGAYELPGQNPDPEPRPYTGDEEKTIFIDDFADLDFDHDPWLDSVGVQGLAWTQSAGDSSDYEVLHSDDLDASAAAAEVYGNGGPALLLADQHRAWKTYTYTLRASNPGVQNNDGIVLSAADEDDFYFLDLGRSGGRLYRYLDGTATILDSSDVLALTTRDATVFKLSVTTDGSGITIAVDRDADGSDELSFTDTDATAIGTFTGGGRIGLYHFYDASVWHRIYYTDIRIEVSEFGDTLRPSDICNIPAVSAGPLFMLSSQVITDRLTVFTDGTAIVSIHTAAGAELARNRRGQNAFVWHTANAPAGAYYVRIHNGCQQAVARIMRIK